MVLHQQAPSGCVVSERHQHRFHLKRRQGGVRAEDASDQSGDVRRGKTVARGSDRSATDPSHLEVDARRPLTSLVDTS